MKVVLQRVSSAVVRVDGDVVAEIGPGFLALVGVAPGDGEDDARALARKTARLRVFDGSGRGEERSVIDIDGAVLVVSQFTLLADTRRGNRPSWSGAAHPDHARNLVAAYAEALSREGATVRTGSFGAHMSVTLTNDGPVTLILESPLGEPAPER